MHGKTLFKWLVIVMILAQLAACAQAATPAPKTEAPAVKTEAPAAKTEAPAAKTEAPAAVTEAPAAVTEAPAASTEAPAAQGKYPPVVVAVWSSPEHDNLVKDAAAYEKETGNKIIVEEIARESYQDKLSTVLVAGGSDYDAFYAISDNMPQWTQAKLLADFNQFIDDPKVASPDLNLDKLKPGVNWYTFDNKIYGYPSDGDTAWLWYRKDLLDEKGIKVPETWDEFLAAAKALNNPPEMYGAVIGAKPDEAAWDFMYYHFGMGGDILDANYKPIINDENGVKALTFYSDLKNKDKVVPPDVVTYGYNEILTALQQGKAAMGIEWMAATATLQDCAQSPKVCKDGQPLLQYTMPPGIKQDDGTIKRSVSGSQWGWAIPAGSKNQEAAYKFIEWLTGKEGATMWAMNGGIPSNLDALTDPEVVAKVPQFKLLAEVMPFRHIFPATTVSGDLVNIYNEAINSTVAGAKEPKAALDEAALKMEEALKKGGYIK